MALLAIADILSSAPPPNACENATEAESSSALPSGSAAGALRKGTAAPPNTCPPTDGRRARPRPA
eukprot:7563920-Alexandrium_andersonii.AAC.1